MNNRKNRGFSKLGSRRCRRRPAEEAREASEADHESAANGASCVLQAHTQAGDLVLILIGKLFGTSLL